VNDIDLASAFAEARATVVAPPHGLHPPAMIAAGRRVRRRRQIGATAGGGLAVLVALVVGMGIVNAAPSTPDVPPARPGPTSTAPSPTPTRGPSPATTPATTPSTTPAGPAAEPTATPP
jgi:hypothetical protein